MSIAGKVILYTGAAGALGAETTLSFLRAGARVVAIATTRQDARARDASEREGLGGLTVRAIDLAA